MADTFQSLNAKIARLVKELDDDDAVLKDIGKMAKDEAAEAVRSDIGDESMSGWPRRAPIAVAVRWDIVGKGKLLVKPASRRSAGPWTVMEQGRNQGNASGFAGPSINRKTGLTSFTKSGAVRKSRGARARRWNGVTQGKGTASDAVAKIEAKVPRMVQTHVPQAIRKAGLR